MGDALRKWRDFHDITQIQVSAALGLSERTVQRWELGEKSPGPSLLQCRELEARWPGILDALIADHSSSEPAA